MFRICISEMRVEARSGHPVEIIIKTGCKKNVAGEGPSLFDAVVNACNKLLREAAPGTREYVPHAIEYSLRMRAGSGDVLLETASPPRRKAYAFSASLGNEVLLLIEAYLLFCLPGGSHVTFGDGRQS